MEYFDQNQNRVKDNWVYNCATTKILLEEAYGSELNDLTIESIPQMFINFIQGSYYIKRIENIAVQN